MAEENKQVTEVEEGRLETEHRWTFLKYIKSIAHFKWWIIGFTIGGIAIGYFGLRFFFNPSRKSLSASFTYDLAGSYDAGNNDTIRFIDGTTFNLYDLTNRENLQKVVDDAKDESGKGKYDGIDINRILNNNAIALSKTVKYYNNNDPTSSYVTYSISSSASSFPSVELGKDFLFDLINLPKGLSSQAIDNYRVISYMTDNFDSLSFEKQINQLENQYYVNDDVFSSLASVFGNSAIANEDGKKVYELQNSYRSKYTVFSSQTFIQELISSKDVNKFINYNKGEESATISLIHQQCNSYIETVVLDKQKLSVLQANFDELVNGSSTIDTDTNLSAHIVDLSKQIINLKNEIDSFEKTLNNSGYFLDNNPTSPTYGKYVFDELNEDTVIYKLTVKEDNWVNSCEAFKNKIKNYKNNLDNQDREAAGKAYSYCFRNYKNRVNIQNGGYVNASGGISTIIGAVAGGVVFFAITSLVTATIYVYKEKEN